MESIVTLYLNRPFVASVGKVGVVRFEKHGDSDYRADVKRDVAETILRSRSSRGRFMLPKMTCSDESLCRSIRGEPPKVEYPEPGDLTIPELMSYVEDAAPSVKFPKQPKRDAAEGFYRKHVLGEDVGDMEEEGSTSGEVDGTEDESEKE